LQKTTVKAVHAALKSFGEVLGQVSHLAGPESREGTPAPVQMLDGSFQRALVAVQQKNLRARQ
jgi:hypothetical protein